MATTRIFPLHADLLGGVDTTSPAHQLKADQWRQQHNFRLEPTLQQIPRKLPQTATLGVAADVRWLGIVPGNQPGYGEGIALTPTNAFRYSATAWGSLNYPLADDGQFRRWSTALYNSGLYFINELNSLSVYANGGISTIASAPAGRYLSFWYDHVVIGYPTGSPNKLKISGLYNFSDWTPSQQNEADDYDFVEWQQTDYPFVGVTGLGKLRGQLIVHTPTAIIPLQYVGLPKVFRVVEEAIVTRTGNTFPWTLVCLDTVQFFFEFVERMFFAYDGQQVLPIGEPVKQFLTDYLHDDIVTASRMYGYVDNVNHEIWWPFVSVAQAVGGQFDKAVVFDYRNKKWFTASVENVHCFCGGSRTTSTIESLTGTIEALPGTIESLGLDLVGLARVYGTANGTILREETVADTTGFAVPYDNPVLESPDFSYDDIRTIKEVDAMILNTTATSVEIRASSRDFLGSPAVYSTDPLAVWIPTLIDAMVNWPAKSGRVFRYLFTLINSRNATFDAFSEGVYMKKAEK